MKAAVQRGQGRGVTTWVSKPKGKGGGGNAKGGGRARGEHRGGDAGRSPRVKTLSTLDPGCLGPSPAVRGAALRARDDAIAAANAAKAGKGGATPAATRKQHPPRKTHRIYAKSIYKGVCGKSQGKWTWRYGACKGVKRQENHSFLTSRAAAEKYDEFVLGLVNSEPAYRKRMMYLGLNFCILCKEFRNPKKIKGPLPGVLCACKTAENHYDGIGLCLADGGSHL